MYVATIAATQYYTVHSITAHYAQMHASPEIFLSLNANPAVDIITVCIY